METARTTTAGTSGEMTGHIGFRARRKCPRLFVPYVYPGNFTLADGVRDVVKRIADDTVTALYARRLKSPYDDVGNFLFAHEAFTLGLDDHAWFAGVMYSGRDLLDNFPEDDSRNVRAWRGEGG
jgi:hypothetical protein